MKLYGTLGKFAFSFVISTFLLSISFGQKPLFYSIEPYSTAILRKTSHKIGDFIFSFLEEEENIDEYFQNPIMDKFKNRYKKNRDTASD